MSAEVPVGSYIAFLQEGWVLERLNPGTTTHAVQAQLISPNPAGFYVHPNLSTLVALRFRAGTDVVELDRGAFDIVLEVEEQPPLAGTGSTEGCTPETDGQYGTRNCGLMVQDGVQQTQNGSSEDCADLGGVMGCVMSVCEESVTYHALECQCQAG
ncbi:hypothetical protein WMF38_10770 [Sorangium sp. So ce118]